jgi:magnesium transporter
MIRSFLARDGKLQVNLSRAEIASFLESDTGVIWVDLESPDASELSILSEVFHFHPLAVEDASKESDLPKADVYVGYAHIVIHRPRRAVRGPEEAPGELDMFLSQRYLVTVHDAASVSAAEAIKRIGSRPGILEAGPDRIMYELLDLIVDRQLHLLDHYEAEIEALEDEILSGNARDGLLERGLDLRRDLAEIRKSLGPQRDLINRIARRDIPYVTEAIEPYLRDVVDHIARAHQSLESQRDHLAYLFEAFMAVSSNRLSHVMKRLTLIATIFLPLSFVAGLYGMNFQWMPGAQHPYGFFIIVSVMASLAIGMLWFFRRRKLW